MESGGWSRDWVESVEVEQGLSGECGGGAGIEWRVWRVEQGLGGECGCGAGIEWRVEGGAGIGWRVWRWNRD